ncbi:MAG: porin family protein [Candidatus Stygibacter frigidus]|nr:porin family protein [Candidatus Stygibacter frigidus]
MKQSKSIVLIGLILLSSSLLFSDGITNIGIKGGLNLTNFSISGDTSDDPEFLDYHSRLDFCLGGFLEYEIEQKMFLQPEILYTRKGATHEFHGGVTVNGQAIYDGTNKGDHIVSYLQIPILLKYRISDKIGLLTGPSIGILLSHIEKLHFDGEYLGQSYSHDYEEDFNEYTNSTDFSLVIGGEYCLNKFVLDLRYDLSLSTLSKEEGENNFKNRVFSFLIGYKF